MGVISIHVVYLLTIRGREI